MAGAVRGVVSFQVDGDKYSLHLSTNAMCELEALYDEPLQDVLNRLSPAEGSPKISDVRALFQVMLVGDFDDVIAGEIIDAIGFSEAGAKMAEAAQLAFPDTEESEPGEGKPKGA